MTDFETNFAILLPWLTFAFFLILGEILKDNAYRTIAGLLLFFIMATGNAPVPAVMNPLLLVAAIYLVFIVWMMQPLPRPGARFLGGMLDKVNK